MHSARASEITSISGSLSSAETTGSVYMPKNYSNVTSFFAGAKEDGSNSSATYQVELRNSNGDRRAFQMTLKRGQSGYATIGSMEKGTWNYTIKRSSGTGTFVYVITFSG